jgi:hypothetical protein
MNRYINTVKNKKEIAATITPSPKKDDLILSNKSSSKLSYILLPM